MVFERVFVSDEATCGYIIVMTKEEKLLELKENYTKEVERVEYLFKE